MPDIKQLRTRIRSVQSTLHLTHAMQLVASSKIRRASERMELSAEHAGAFQTAMDILTSSGACAGSPWLAQRAEGKYLLVVIAGDRGLAGGYNANVFRLMREYPEAQVIPIGKRACDRYRKPARSSEEFSSAEGYELAKEQCDEFLAGEFDRLGIVSSVYHSVLSQEATVTWLLPLQASDAPVRAGTVFEPDEETIFRTVVPEYVAALLMGCVRESFACEVAARRTAMDSAGKNAEEMIDHLQLEYNRARQGAITQEITEIVAGAAE